MSEITTRTLNELTTAAHELRDRLAWVREYL